MTDKEAKLLLDTARRGDRWMIKTIFLVLVLRRFGIDIDWFLQFNDKQAIYNAIERLMETEKNTMIFQHTIDKVLSGQKTQTSRLAKENETLVEQGKITILYSSSQGYPHGRIKYATGRTYAVQRGRGIKAEGRIIITRIIKADVRTFSMSSINREGFETAKDFYQIWCKINDPKALPLVDGKLSALLSRPYDRYQAWIISFELQEQGHETT